MSVVMNFPAIQYVLIDLENITFFQDFNKL